MYHPWRVGADTPTMRPNATASRRHCAHCVVGLQSVVDGAVAVKTRSEVTAEKLRGGFYSPASLVAACLARVSELTLGRGDLRVLEPTVGDGAFIRGLANAPLRARVGYLEAIEILPEEAARARVALASAGFAGAVYVESFLAWPRRHHVGFDAALGNPPFVRFQFLTEDDKATVPELERRLGVALNGVSNLWIPVLLVALASLREGGAFAFIVPTELFTGISANTVRRWLCEETTDLEAQLFPPGSFPGVLQEVTVLSGRRGRPVSPSLTFFERRLEGDDLRWRHVLDPAASTWTRYLLPPDELEAFTRASEAASIERLGTIARFEVAAVTGANEFFSVSKDVIREFGLGGWVRPLLPRVRQAPGLRYTREDHEAATDKGSRTALLDFSAERPDPTAADAPRRYLRRGEEAGIHLRYKTRIRTPWYRVPQIRVGRLMLSKRSHRFPRLILNDAGAVTTDTIYRGTMRPAFAGREEDLVAAFHNSLTLLSAEIEGRSFGGGVLELVPSEVSRLLVPVIPGAGIELDRLSLFTVARNGEESDTLVDKTDELLITHSSLDRESLRLVRSARRRLLDRRLARTVSPESGCANETAA